MFVVFDLDGTISNHDDRNADPRFACPTRGGPHLRADIDWDYYFLMSSRDTPHKHVIQLMSTLHRCGHNIDIWTGRGEVARKVTEWWLDDHIVPYHRLIMRGQGDHRPDTELKASWAEEFGRPDLVFEDRDRMVKMWRSLGIPCFQVADGKF